MWKIFVLKVLEKSKSDVDRKVLQETSFLLLQIQKFWKETSVAGLDDEWYGGGSCSVIFFLRFKRFYISSADITDKKGP